MALFFSKGAYLVHKAQSRFEVRKGEVPFQMMVVHNLPFGHLTFQWPNLDSGQGRHPAPAWDACLFCKS